MEVGDEGVLSAIITLRDSIFPQGPASSYRRTLQPHCHALPDVRFHFFGYEVYDILDMGSWA